MGQHRTKKEKEKAEKIRLKEIQRDVSSGSEGSYQYASEDIERPYSGSLLKVDSQYIVKDLIKTIVISGCLLCVVIGIYFYLRYN
ncbi:MAG: hypothetical protein QG639_985 [Patescibacteria group bacterium]|jgi:hypothetical protein|nr:hypothetical protein [Patescibacteria group bacterium]